MKALLTTFVITILCAGHGQRCYADDLVGLWQTETNNWSVPGHTNMVEAVETIEFARDHSFKITEVTVVEGKRWTNVSYTGTYTVLATNRANLKVTPRDIPPGATPPQLTVTCSLIGNELEVPKFTTSVISEYKRYRRVNRAAALNPAEAHALAVKLANQKARELFHCEPFQNGPPPQLAQGWWVWHDRRGQGASDFEANVKFMPDGSNPDVSVTQLYSVNIPQSR